jgi:hypothetical protein
MATQELNRATEADASHVGPLASIRSLGSAPRRKRPTGEDAWRATLTQHAPEPWPAARLALQARIAALDVN